MLNIIAYQFDPNDEDYAIWTMSLKPAVMSAETARGLGILQHWQGKKPHQMHYISYFQFYHFMSMIIIWFLGKQSH